MIPCLEAGTAQALSYTLYHSLASFPGPSFSFNRDGEKLDLVYTVCTCAKLRATRGEKGVCDLPVLFQGGKGGTQYCSPESTRRGSKDVLEAVFAVKVEAGDGMQQPSSIV